MYAIEFETQIKDGLIKLPEMADIQNLANQCVRVILLAPEANVNQLQKEKAKQFKELVKERKSFPKVDKQINLIELADKINDDIF